MHRSHGSPKTHSSYPRQENAGAGSKMPVTAREHAGAGCPYDPRVLAGEPIGMLHCPTCGCMVVAGLQHPVCDADFCAYGVPIDYQGAPVMHTRQASHVE